MIGNAARRRIGAAAFALLLACAPCLFAGEAAAHATLIASDPVDGSVLERAPGQLTLRFNEAVSVLVVRLLDSTGADLRLSAVDQRDARIVVVPGAPLASGTHVLSWRVVSADGHPVGGAVVFSIGAPSAGAVALPREDGAVRIAVWVVRWLVYAALFVGVGGVFCCRWLANPARRDVEGVLFAGLWIGVLAVPVSIGLQGLDLLALPLARIFAGEVWTAGAQSAYAATARMALSAILLALVAARVPGRTAGRSLSAAALVGVGLALAASGHASAAEPQFLMRPAVFLHGIGLAFWIGALLPLGAALRRAGASAERILLQFSRAAPFAVLPLAATGIVLAIVQLGSPDGLWTTAYGQLLLCKALLLMGIFSLALWNRFSLTPCIRAGDHRAASILVTSIKIELALAVAVFAVVAAWRFTPPPRAFAAAAPALVHARTDRAAADVEFRPGRAGSVRVAIRPLRTDRAPLEVREVVLLMSNPDAGIEPIRRPAGRAEAGVWMIDGLTIPVAGRWQVQVDLLVSDFEQITLSAPVAIRP